MFTEYLRVFLQKTISNKKFQSSIQYLINKEFVNFIVDIASNVWLMPHLFSFNYSEVEVGHRVLYNKHTILNRKTQNTLSQIVYLEIICHFFVCDKRVGGLKLANFRWCHFWIAPNWSYPYLTPNIKRIFNFYFPWNQG